MHQHVSNLLTCEKTSIAFMKICWDSKLRLVYECSHQLLIVVDVETLGHFLLCSRLSTWVKRNKKQPAMGEVSEDFCWVVIFYSGWACEKQNVNFFHWVRWLWCRNPWVALIAVQTLQLDRLTYWQNLFKNGVKTGSICSNVRKQTNIFTTS